MLTVKITPVGNSMGILLPKEALSKLKVAKGDTLYLVEGPDGYTITPFEQDFEEQMEAADSLMKRYRNTLRQLAKRKSHAGCLSKPLLLFILWC